MAFNPSRKVAAARDYAENFGFDQVIIIGIARRGVNIDGEISYASYGKNPTLCTMTKQMADKIFKLLGVR